MKSVLTLLQLAEYKALSSVTLFGSVLDLGGEKRGEYLSRIGGTFSTTVINLDPDATPDISHDLETLLPIATESYDHVLAINVFEHVYNYRQLLAEAVRAVRPGGKIVIIVPFLFPVHPSPSDYWRFTGETLRRELDGFGLSDINVEALGSGVFAARYVMLDRILPNFLRIFNYYSFRYCASFLDRVFVGLARALGKSYAQSDYALGYLIQASKPSSNLLTPDAN